MKVVYICSMKKGLASFIYREIEMLFERGLQVSIFALKFGKGIYMPKDDWKYYHFNPVIVVLLQPLFFIQRPVAYIAGAIEALKTKSMLDFVIANYYAPTMKKIGAEKIHCQEGLHAVFIGYYCSKLLKIPLSVMVHADTLYVNPNPEFAKIALAACDAVLTVSDYNREKLIEKFGLLKEKVSVVRLGVEPQKYVSGNKKKVMIVGQHAARKGHDTLFQAVQMLNRDDVELWVVGSGTWGRTDYVDVEKIARDLGIYEKIVFFRNISEEVLTLLYQNCDIFCLPSRTSPDGNKEGIPVSLMEAMASGKPVISTYHTGIPELVKEILVEENDAESLSKGLLKLLDDISLRSKMGEANQAIIKSKYSLSDNVDKLAAYFKEGRCV